MDNIREILSEEETVNLQCPHCPNPDDARIKKYMSVLKCPVVFNACSKRCAKSKEDELYGNGFLYCPICFVSINGIATISAEKNSKEQMLICTNCAVRSTPAICCNTLQDNLYEHDSDIRTVYFKTAKTLNIGRFKRTENDFIGKVRCCEDEECDPIRHIKVWANNTQKVLCFECRGGVNMDDRYPFVGSLIGNYYLCCSDECGDKIIKRFEFERCNMCKQYGTLRCGECNNEFCKEKYYCSKKCQKEDYEIYRIRCPNLKTN